MDATHPYWYVSGAALLAAIAWFLISGTVGVLLLLKVLPILTEIRQHIQDLGDLSANAVGSASDTMDLVEARVSQTMGNATQGGVSATRQMLGIGSALAGIYIVSRVATLLRGGQSKKRTKSGRNRWKL